MLAFPFVCAVRTFHTSKQHQTDGRYVRLEKTTEALALFYL